jgi:hypothetical protein
MVLCRVGNDIPVFLVAKHVELNENLLFVVELSSSLRMIKEDDYVIFKKADFMKIFQVKRSK